MSLTYSNGDNSGSNRYRDRRPVPAAPSGGGGDGGGGGGGDGATVRRGGVAIHHGDALDLYDDWPAPTAIVSDGPYGIAGYDGDLPSPRDLPDWYRPHIARWSAAASGATTLWFWNTEAGWAVVHPLLEEYGWIYRAANIWDKGLAQIAGNSNTSTALRFPVVTEICVQYVRPLLITPAGAGAGAGGNGNGTVPLRQWLRNEWLRSGLPLRLADTACGVRNAASRKYLAADDAVWYPPPPAAYASLSYYANRHGDPDGRPYFSIDGIHPLADWRDAAPPAQFHCPAGVTNVWRTPSVRGAERVRNGCGRTAHPNQKPLLLMERIIRAATDPGHAVWEPFGGLCTAALAALNAGRVCHSAEIRDVYYRLAARRLAGHGVQPRMDLA